MEVRLSLTTKDVYNLLNTFTGKYSKLYKDKNVSELGEIVHANQNLPFAIMDFPETMQIYAKEIEQILGYPGFKMISLKRSENKIRKITDYFMYITISPEMLLERKYTNKIFMLTEANIKQLQFAWAKAILTVFPNTLETHKKYMRIVILPYIGLLDLARVDYAINLSSNKPELALAMMCKSHRQKYTPIKAYLDNSSDMASDIIGFSQNTTYKHVSCYIKACKKGEDNEEILREARENNLIRFEVGKQKQDAEDNFFTIMSELRSKEMIEQAYNEVGYGRWYSEYKFNKVLEKAIVDGLISKHNAENIKQVASIVSYSHNFLLSNEDFHRRITCSATEDLKDDKHIGFPISKLMSKTNMWTGKNLYVSRKEITINNKKVKGKSYDTYYKMLKVADDLNLQLVRIPKSKTITGGCLENPFSNHVLLGENHQADTYDLDNTVVGRIKNLNDEYDRYADNPLCLVYEENDLVFDCVIHVTGIIRKNIVNEANKICYVIAETTCGLCDDDGNYESVRILGNLWGISEEDYLHVVGKWSYHRTYGEYINVEKFTFAVPDLSTFMRQNTACSSEDEEKDINENESANFSGNTDSSEENTQDIIRDWEKINRVIEIKSYLQQHKLYGKLESYQLLVDKIDDISCFIQNPYVFANDLFDFNEIDRFAMTELNLPKDNLYRIRAGYEYLRKSKLEEGNTAWPYDDMLSECEILLEIPKEKLRTVVDVEARTIGQMAILSYHDFEKNIADKLKELLSRPGLGNMRRKNIAIDAKYTDKQREAIEKAIFGKSGVFVLTGGPGTGKTTTVKEIVKQLRKLREKVVLVAPTGRAAERLKQSTGLRTYTLHKRFSVKTNDEGFLVSSPKEDKEDKEDKKVENFTVLVCDETSMVSVEMFSLLLDIVTRMEGFKKLILVGDPDQLPSIEPGAVLRDICQCDKIDRVNLSEVQRQAAGSPIITLANRIISGEKVDVALDKNQAEYLIDKNDDAIVSEITEIVTKDDSDCDDFEQVLCCTNVGLCGTREINCSVQMNRIKKYGYRYFKISTDKRFYIDDKVIQTKNDYKTSVMNGEIGQVNGITSPNCIRIKFEGKSDGIFYSAKNLINVDLAYAISVHKSQGSEFKVVVLAVPENGNWDRNMLYTAVTRAKEKVVFVGSIRAINKAVEKKYERITALVKYLN